MSAFGGHAKDAIHTYPRHRFDAAKVAVTRATALPASKYVVGCLSFGCTGLLLLGSSIGLALAGFAELIVVAALVAMIPFIAGIVNMRPKTSAAKVLDAMTCPQCRAATTRRVDASTKAYVLVCEQCRVVWETAVPLPGDGDHIHTQTDHHHHHHHFSSGRASESATCVPHGIPTWANFGAALVKLELALWRSLACRCAIR